MSEAAGAKPKVLRRSGWVFKARGQGGRTAWAIRYFDVDGRLHQERTDAANKTLARRILAERQDGVEQARLMKLGSVQKLVRPAEAVTLRSFAKEYMTHPEAHLAEHTAEVYRMNLDKRNIPTLGSKALREITAGDVQSYVDSRLADGAAPATVRQDLAIISGIYREAAKRNLVDRNPARMVKKPRLDNEIVRFLGETEEKTLLGWTPEHFRASIIFAIHSGLRESEQTGLTWANVRWPMDPERPETGHVVVRRTKSHRDRIVPMNATLHRTLLALKVRNGHAPYVFANPDTKAPHDRFNNTTWRTALKRAGIECRWHDLRNTFCSRLAQRGVSIAAIQELAGHSSLVVPQRYMHLQRADLGAAVLALDSASPAQKPAGATPSAPSTLIL